MKGLSWMSPGISATTDFGEVQKTEAFYTKVCQALNVGARDVVHVGDHWEFDYVAPTRAGLRAYYLDRTRHSNGPGVVHDLNEFAREVLNESGTS
jgi:putative hydrolase of the HAD superfamily